MGIPAPSRHGALPNAPELPARGWSTDETLERLEALRATDVRWKEGRGGLSFAARDAERCAGNRQPLASSTRVGPRVFH